MAVVRTHQQVLPRRRKVSREGFLVALIMVLAVACGSKPSPPATERMPKSTASRDTTEALANDAVEKEEVQGKDDGHHVGALETYRYWAGQDPDADMQVLNGEYWSSAHWTKEYSLYMELRFPRARDFVMSNGFKRSAEWKVVVDAPEWFDPPKSYEVWEGESGSLYYLHPKKGHIYMFERQF